MPRPLKQNGRAAKLFGSAATVECADCCDPIPGEPWLEGALCECSDSDQDRAWMRTSDYLGLRREGPCPTGRLTDGSCWEFLPDAATRPTDPPFDQQLMPSRVGGCCVCCPDCSTTRLEYITIDPHCTDRVDSFPEVCCESGQNTNSFSYVAYRDFWGPTTKCFQDGFPLERFAESWTSCGEFGCAVVFRDRRWNSGVPGTPCRLIVDDTSTLVDPRGHACRDEFKMWDPRGPDQVIRPPAFSLPTTGSPLCGECESNTGYMRQGILTTWNTSRSEPVTLPTPGCFERENLRGVSVRWPLPTLCRGGCGDDVILPPTPPPPIPFPEGAGSVPNGIPSGRVVVQFDAGADFSENSSGCSSCGGDGGL